MFFKNRFLKIGCITGAILAFLGYFAFSTFLFKPFEGAWEYDVAGLIPRQVDFFVAKARLDQDFEDFPRLRVADAIEQTTAWTSLEASAGFQKWKADNDIDGLLARIRAEVAKLPLGTEPEDVFGGKDLALAGQFQPGGLERSDWAIYGRVNWMGKLAVSSLAYPGLLGLDAQGLSVSKAGKTRQISGGQLERPLFVARVRDVVMAGTSQALVEKAIELEAAGGENSLFLSAGYQDYIYRDDREPGDPEFEVVLDVNAMLQTMQLAGPYPDTGSQRFLPAFLGRLIQVPSWKTVEGIVGFPEGLRVDLHGSFSSERISDFQNRLYREDSFDRDQLLSRAARLAPKDCVMFAYIHGPVADILRQAFQSVEPALRSNLDEALRSTGRFTGGLDELIDSLGSALRNRTALIVREQDYGPVVARIEGGEQVEAEHDGSPVYAITIVNWLEKRDGAANTLDSIRDAIGQNPEKFGLKGYNPKKANDTGFYKYDSNGFETREFWSPFIPGTGMISTQFTDEKEHLWITNHEAMLKHVRYTYYQGAAGGYPRLSEDPRFQALVDSALPSANLVVWVNPRKASPTMRALARRAAQDSALSDVNWKVRRREVETQVLAESFPGVSRTQLTGEQSEQLQASVDRALDEWAETYRAERVPALVEEAGRSITLFESISAMLFELDLNPDSFSLAARILTPLEPAGTDQ